MNFNQKEWIHLGQWVQPTISESFWNYWSQNNKFPFDIPQLDGRLFVFHGHHFVRKSDVEVMKQFFLKQEWDFSFLEMLTEWVDDIHNNCVKKINLRFDHLSESLRNLQEVGDNNVNAWIFFLILNDILGERIEGLCQEQGYDFNIILKNITPLKKSFAVKRLEEAVKVKDLNEQDKKLHTQSFSFVGMHHFVGKPYTELSTGIVEEKRTFSIPLELKWHAKLGSIAAWARTHMAETSGYIQHKIRPVLLEVNEKLQLNETEYLWLSCKELIQALDNPKAFAKPNLQKRKEKVGTYSEGARTIIIGAEEVDEALNQLLPEKKAITFPLKGRSASPGKVQGRAKVIIRPEDIQKLQHGDIMVAPETAPDFMAAFHKAAGVITNQGGITSHAAIVSREFGLPCIVGVEGATDIIKDNELIELDADKGIIRKINPTSHNP